MNQSKGRKNRNATSKPRNKIAEKQIPAEGIYTNQRFMHAAASLVGCTAQILTQNNTWYEGIFYTFSEEFHIVLKLAHMIDPAQPNMIDKDSVVETLIFKPQDVVDIVFKDVDMDFASQDSFTDAAISGGWNGQVEEKELQPWNAPPGDDVCLELSSATNGWDEGLMLKTNEEKFGLASTYDESLSNYTVQLEKKNTEEYKQMEAKASKIASEIESSSSYRTRAELENGDEEQTFAAVVRDPSNNKYVPPTRRKNPPPPRQQQQRLNNRNYSQHLQSRNNHAHPPVMHATTGQQNTPSYAHPSSSPQTTPSQTYPTTYVPMTMSEEVGKKEKSPPSNVEPPKPQRTTAEMPKPQRVPQVTSAPSQERGGKSIASLNNRKSPPVEPPPPIEEEKRHVIAKPEEEKTSELKRFSENFHLVSPEPVQRKEAEAAPVMSDTVKNSSLNPTAKEFVPRAPSTTPTRPMTPATPQQQQPQPNHQVNFSTEEYPISIPRPAVPVSANYFFPVFSNVVSQPGLPPGGGQQGPPTRNMRKGNNAGGARADMAASINAAAVTGPPLLTPHVAPQPTHNAPAQYLTLQYPAPQYPTIVPIRMVHSSGPPNHPESSGAPQHLFVSAQGHGPNQGPPNPPGPNQPPNVPQQMSFPPPHSAHPNAQSQMVFIPPHQFQQGGPHVATSTVAMPQLQYIQHPQPVMTQNAPSMMPPS